MCAMPVVLCGSVGLILEISVSHLKAEIGSMKYEHTPDSDLAPHYTRRLEGKGLYRQSLPFPAIEPLIFRSRRRRTWFL